MTSAIPSDIANGPNPTNSSSEVDLGVLKDVGVRFFYIWLISVDSENLKVNFSDTLGFGKHPYQSWLWHFINHYWTVSYACSHYWSMDASQRRHDSWSISTTSFGLYWYCSRHNWIFWFIQGKTSKNCKSALQMCIQVKS